MALQIAVVKISVTDAGSVYAGVKLSITMNLKCWTEGDDPETDPAVIDSEFSGDYSTIDGLTVQQQVDKTVAEIQAKMQVAIDEYKRELALLSNALLDTAVTTIQTNLEG